MVVATLAGRLLVIASAESAIWIDPEYQHGWTMIEVPEEPAEPAVPPQQVASGVSVKKVHDGDDEAEQRRRPPEPTPEQPDPRKLRESRKDPAKEEGRDEPNEWSQQEQREDAQWKGGSRKQLRWEDSSSWSWGWDERSGDKDEARKHKPNNEGRWSKEKT